MAANKIYTGFSLEDDTIKIARISVSGKVATLEKVDKIKLVNPLKKNDSDKDDGEEIFNAFDELEDESIFGIEEDQDIEGDILAGNDEDLDVEDELDDLDLGLDLDLDDEENIMDIDDMASDIDSETAASNEVLVYNILTDLDSSKIRMSVNIPSGSTIFQILKDLDFSSIKKKDLKIIVDDRLEALYGSPKGADYYSSTIRDDGSLLLVSIDDDPQVLQLIHKAESIYRGKVTINEVLPDESLIIGLFRSNYEVDAESITALIQYSEESCRVIFLKGSDLLIISPIIPEGSSSRKFLNTVFSKILFQLDTGEVPNLDRIILCNNHLGDTALEFFEDRFPDIEVSDFIFNDEIFDTNGFEPGVIASFTSAISLAWADAGFKKESYPDISFLPSYVKDRQKIFKLQWHGFILVALIISVFPITNYFYIGNSTNIDGLRDNVSSRKAEIRVLENTVQEYNRISSELEAIQTRLVLLDELSEGTLRWSVNLDLMNKGIDNIDSIWLTNFTDTGESGIDVNGIALYRNRIPMIADMFHKAVLKDVERTLIRDREVFSFTYTISDVVADEQRYTPESSKGLKEVLGGNQ
jgi:Tfp pilus assembly protein PilN